MQTITFYSYKGGSGRSLLLANAARFLALAGKRVVALDFDLEAPGLHYKLSFDSSGQRPADVVPERGVVDYILAANAGDEPARLEDYLMPVTLPPGSGELWLMPAGAAPSGEYWRALTRLAKLGILSDPDGLLIADFLELKYRLEDDLELDYLLIDARTGITELTGIATTLLADTVVCLMLDNPESLAGTRAVLRSFGRAIRLEGQDAIEVFPVLSRVPERVEETVLRVAAFLSEPDPDGQTFSLDRLYVLPDDRHLAQGERVLLAGELDDVTSALGMGYLDVMGDLFPSVAGSQTNAFYRQESVRQMQAWLLGDGAAVHPSRGMVQHGVRVPISPSDPYSPVRYADLAVKRHQDPSPFLVAEYVVDLAESDAWSWWQHNTNVTEVVLFATDAGGRLLTRRFVRDAEGSLDEEVR